MDYSKDNLENGTNTIGKEKVNPKANVTGISGTNDPAFHDDILEKV